MGARPAPTPRAPPGTIRAQGQAGLTHRERTSAPARQEPLRTDLPHRPSRWAGAPTLGELPSPDSFCSQCLALGPARLEMGSLGGPQPLPRPGGLHPTSREFLELPASPSHHGLWNPHVDRTAPFQQPAPLPPRQCRGGGSREASCPPRPCWGGWCQRWGDRVAWGRPRTARLLSCSQPHPQLTVWFQLTWDPVMFLVAAATWAGWGWGAGGADQPGWLCPPGGALHHGGDTQTLVATQDGPWDRPARAAGPGGSPCTSCPPAGT